MSIDQEVREILLDLLMTYFHLREVATSNLTVLKWNVFTEKHNMIIGLMCIKIFSISTFSVI